MRWAAAKADAMVVLKRPILGRFPRQQSDAVSGISVSKDHYLTLIPRSCANAPIVASVESFNAADSSSSRRWLKFMT